MHRTKIYSNGIEYRRRRAVLLLFACGVDMRKGIHSLYGIIKCESKISPLSGSAFVFIGTSQKSVKILRWHREGFILHHKKLEVGRYILPRMSAGDAFSELDHAQVDKLIATIKHRGVVNELKAKVISNF